LSFPLFPRFLNVKSKGLAVNMLICLFAGTEYDPLGELQADGDYGQVLEMVVRRFQEAHGLEIDGNFGPDTRAKVKEEFGIDINAIRFNFSAVTTAVFPDGSIKVHPKR